MRQSWSSLLHRGAIVAGVVALGLPAVAPVALAQTDKARTVIDTVAAWNGKTAAKPFGCNGGTTTYGQVFTVPANRHHLRRLVLKWTDLAPGSMHVRFELYPWDGTKATGSAIDELRRTYGFGHSGFYDLNLNFNGDVTPGTQYVAFGSIDKEFEACSTFQVGWALDRSDAYSGGEFVYLNSSGDESQWTTTPWSRFGKGWDAAFKLTFIK